MSQPRSERPYMPGYGIVGPSEGSGLLPWSWAEERLTASLNYWVVTVWPDGRPHTMPVWGVWYEESLWFSSSGGARKTRNLMANAHCVVAAEDARDPVVMEGTAELITDLDVLAGVLARMNAKYSTDYSMELLDPEVSATFRVRPRWVFGLTEEDFTGSPTRWSFEN